MKIYNKFVESKKEPSNKNDIWFDGSSWNMYKEGMWRSFTLPLDAAVEINKILQEDKSVLQQELKNYLKIQDSPFKKGSGQNSVVLKGTSNSATNKFATAFGEQTTASADRAFSEGLKTTACGANSHAEGLSTLAEGQNSHVEGNKCKAIGKHSHAEGNDTITNGGASHAEGSGTITQNNFEHAEGRYNFSNKEDSSNNWGGYNTIHSVGIGNSNNNRKNAHEILQNGKHYVYGIGGYNGTNVLDLDGETVTAYDLATVINNKAELSDIHQSDWNAQEGEAGYIDNKPFYIEQINIDKNDIVWEDSMDESIAHVQLTQLGTITIYFEDVTDGIIGPLILNEQNEYRGEISASDSSWGVYVNTDNYVLTLQEYNMVGGWIVSITQEVFKQLDSKYLPNTVIKTTPQTLSDTDKNQALANLGLSDVINDLTNIPIVKGDAENSVVLKGGNNIATGFNSYAEGGYTKALSEVAHTEGLKTISGRISQLIDPTTGNIRELTDEEISTLVNEALRIGLITSQNEFNNDVAMKLIGVASHSEGSETKALGTSSHAEGNNTEASSNSSHAEGDSTHAWGEASHAEGYLTEANGNQSHSEGKQTKAQGNSSHAEGIETQANGWGSHAEGQNTVASGDMSHAQGIDTIASGARSFATGDGTIAKGAQSIVGGYKSKSAGDSAISIGHRTYAKGQDSICIGISNHEVNTYESKTNEEILAGVKDGSIVASIALGNQSQAIGGNVFAYGSQAHAEGWRTKAIGNHSHAEGNYSIAEGNNSYAGGNYCNANGTASFATGDHTKTTNANEAAFGKYNKSESNTLFSVGNGTLDTDRKNAVEVKQNGDVYITGIGGFTGANSDSAKSVQEVINELINKLNEITTND